MCVKSCQDWVTTVRLKCLLSHLTAVFLITFQIMGDFVDLRRQGDETLRHVLFIDAHKAYMTEYLDILMDSFKEVRMQQFYQHAS
jgi:hypothetical protein